MAGQSLYHILGSSLHVSDPLILRHTEVLRAGERERERDREVGLGDGAVSLCFVSEMCISVVALYMRLVL